MRGNSDMNIFKVNGEFSLRKLIISIAISEGVGFLSSILSRDGMEKYKELNQPGFAPPSWVFAVVWPILFLLMGFAFYRIWMHHSQGIEVNGAIFYYGAQLVFNFLWSILFFGLGLRGLALIDLLILIAFVVITTVSFFKIDKLAGYVMVPYLIWICFAAFLNYSIWQLNK